MSNATLSPETKIPMLYRRFGRTGLQMPLLTCGGMRYQHGWGDEPLSAIPKDCQENLENTVRRAVELGINHIETARGYGTSEMQLGQILPTLPREKLIVQTKVGPQDDPAEFLATFEKSMRYLKLDYVDLFSFHGINTSGVLDQVMRKGGCLEVGRKLQREGRVRHLGFSTHAPTQVILDAIETDAFDYVNLHWYFVNDFNWRAIQAATRHDMGVFIISPNDKGGMLYAPPPKLVEFCAPLSPMIFNDLYCLKRPEVHTLSIGASKPTDFDEHIAALKLMDQADELVPPIEQRLRGELDRVLGADWVRNWSVGLPEHDQLPGGVNLLEIFRLWNFAKALDLVEFGKMRYNLLGNAGHWFPGQNAASFDEAALKKALADYAYVDRVPTILREAHELLKAEAKKRLSEGG